MDIGGISNYTNYLEEANKASTKELENKLNRAADEDAEDEELLEACKQFEAYLWEQVIKGMEKTTKVFGDDDEEDGYASNMTDYFKETAFQEIAKQITSEEGGANSLSQMLYEQMKRNINPITPADLKAAND
ncbi:MAG: rod-binding protein [Butyrivibrio sp.]|nr:rod-binding protein [Butyrivibrio sp.]